MHNHEVLSALPITKEAYRQGEITKSALRHLSKVLTPQNEAEWLSKTRNLSLRALEMAVREALEEKDSVEEDGGKLKRATVPPAAIPEPTAIRKPGAALRSPAMTMPSLLALLPSPLKRATRSDRG